MIIGIGHDLVRVARFEKLLQDFNLEQLQRIFTPHELEKPTASRLAKRFAAKEACAKALGTGIGAEAFLREIEVQNNEKGAPYLVLSGRALATAASKVPDGHCTCWHLSLCDEGDMAAAYVIFEAIPQESTSNE